VILTIDRLFFAGVGLARIRSFGTLPLWLRAIVPVYAAVSEEVIYRLGVMTVVVWLATAVTRRDAEGPPVAAVWLGILVAAVLFALAHIANVPNAEHPVLRAMVLNGLSGIMLGWLYWKRGFEAALLAHFGADFFIYVLMASLL
jgi:membrane protease YdiL (CAAX protease family)